MLRFGTRGITLVESLVVVAVLALLLGSVTFAFTRRPSAALAARDVATVVRHARWAAVGEGRPIVLLERADGALARSAADGFVCDEELARAVVWEARPGIHVAWPRLAIAFAADGRPRRCDGSGAGNTTIEVADRSGGRAAVVVAITGRVRWERR